LEAKYFTAGDKSASKLKENIKEQSFYINLCHMMVKKYRWLVWSAQTQQWNIFIAEISPGWAGQASIFVK
jgi:hypothetical protein